MANFIGRLGVLLGLDSAEFQKGIKQASVQLDKFVEKTRTASLVGATALAAMTTKALMYADQIIDVAKANDVAVDSVLKLQTALQDNGGEAQNAGRLLSSFVGFIDKAAEGSFEAQKTFQGLGVTFEDLGKLSIDELQNKVVKSLAAIEDPITRNAKAMEVFGKAAKGVDFVGFAASMTEVEGISVQQAKAFQDAADVIGYFEKVARDFSLVLVTELGPALKTTLDYVGDIKGEMTGAGTIFRTVFETVAVLGANVAFVFKGIAGEISHTFENAKLLAKLDFSGARAANEAYDAKIQQRRRELDEFERRVMGGGGGRSGGVSEFDDPRRLDRPQDKPADAPLRDTKAGINKEAEAAKKKADDEAKKRQELILRGIDVEQQQREETNRLLAEQDTAYQKGNAAQIERQQLANIEIDRAKEMLELVFQGRNMRGEDLQLAQELKEIEWKRLDAVTAIKENQLLGAETRAAALERENALAEKAIELATRRNELEKQTREGTLSEGFFNAMAEAARNATTEFERGQQAFQSVMGNMESAINKFVQTGKLSFKDFAASVIKDLIAIQMRAQLIALINMGMRAAGVGGMSLPGLAAGGPVSGGSPYIVGERGPELFVPSNSGAIVPNHRLADSLGGSQPQIVYNGPYIANMSAIDTQSSIQFLAKNKQAVWSANQSAQRSMPVSR
jgi:lambda family phage tail tape measure protein